MYKYLFGPVPSRRLGKSLGIDVVNSKTCNMNCVFCECGLTKEFIKERKSYINLEEMKKEVLHALENIDFDCITLSGSGEPTLNKDLKEIINWLKKTTNKKIVLITNSGLLWKKELREDIKNLDVILPTINTVYNSTFKKINRAYEELDISQIKKGLKALGEEFNGEILLETFIIEGINNTKKELDGLAEFLNSIKYGKLQLNTLDRKGTEAWVKPASKESLLKIKNYLELKNVKNVEIIGKFKTEEKIEKNIELLKNMKSKRNYSEEELRGIFLK
ncbi:radical SAM protein [Fusobacterium sp. IOR10]|uniref:radical SAM protein n=1 Tax=Fusobacterium sp. IOR10 TaxID=2665157 RepID=UPI0013D28171|nr:radical SAM protein [Fusobacterium sp. IOR10]